VGRALALTFVALAAVSAGCGEEQARYPYLVHQMPYNPLPASFRVRPRFVSDDKPLVRALEPKPRGVHVVKYVLKRRRC
jgi:hypothetical protein